MRASLQNLYLTWSYFYNLLSKYYQIVFFGQKNVDSSILQAGNWTENESLFGDDILWRCYIITALVLSLLKSDKPLHYTQSPVSYTAKDEVALLENRNR